MYIWLLYILSASEVAIVHENCSLWECPEEGGNKQLNSEIEVAHENASLPRLGPGWPKPLKIKAEVKALHETLSPGGGGGGGRREEGRGLPIQLGTHFLDTVSILCFTDSLEIDTCYIDSG